MVAAKPVADGQTTHPLPSLGLYVTLYKAFLSVSQAWCVYTALGAYPWHWLFEPRWQFGGSAANRGWSEEQRGADTLYWTSRYQSKAIMLCTPTQQQWPGQDLGQEQLHVCNNLLLRWPGMQVE